MDTDKKRKVNFQQELHGLREAVTEMLARFHQIQSPIRESQEKMPVASKRLRKINDQTEAAATRVLDVAEAITDREKSLLDQLKMVKEEAEKSGLHSLAEKITVCQDLAEQNHDEIFAIIEAIQFQDITSQQMSSTVDLLLDIESRMDVLLEMMDGKKRSVANDKQEKQKVAYDPNAEFSTAKTGQEDIDSLVDTIKRKT